MHSTIIMIGAVMLFTDYIIDVITFLNGKSKKCPHAWKLAIAIVFMGISM